MLYSPPRTHRNAPTAMARTNRNTASLTSLRAAHRPMSTRTATGTALKTAGVFARVGGCSIIPPIRDLVQTLGTSGAGTYHRLVPDRPGCNPTLTENGQANGLITARRKPGCGRSSQPLDNLKCAFLDYP